MEKKRKFLSWFEGARTVLREEGKPLHYKEIMKLALERKHIGANDDNFDYNSENMRLILEKETSIFTESEEGSGVFSLKNKA